MSPEIIAYLGGGVLSVIVWGIRLEGKVKALERENDSLKVAMQTMNENHHSLSLKVVDQLATIREALARIEGRIGDGRSIN